MDAGIVSLFWIIFQSLTWISYTEAIGCIWRSSISATLPESQSITTHPECVDGELYWNNPRGALTAVFTQDGLDKDFSLCLSVAGGNETLTGVYDVSTGSPESLDEFYYDPDPVCVPSVDGQVLLRFDATDDLETLTVITYFKQQPP